MISEFSKWLLLVDGNSIQHLMQITNNNKKVYESYLKIIRNCIGFVRVGAFLAVFAAKLPILNKLVGYSLS